MYAVAGMNAEHIETKVLNTLGIAQIGAQRA
jgi:1-deoxy-D-xylulose-5-phosphate synthase